MKTGLTSKVCFIIGVPLGMVGILIWNNEILLYGTFFNILGISFFVLDYLENKGGKNSSKGI